MRSGSGRSARSTRIRRRRPGDSSRRRPSRAGRTRTSARRLAGGSPCRSPSTPTSMLPRSASTAGARPRASTPSATSRSGPASAAARWPAAPWSTASCTPSSGTCASRTTPRRTRFPAPARITATAGRASRRAPRSRRAGAACPEELAGDDRVWELEARYVALGLVNAICVLSPQRIVLGGGVGTAAGLLPRVHRHVRRARRRLPRRARARRRDRAATSSPPALGSRVRRARRDRPGRNARLTV